MAITQFWRRSEDEVQASMKFLNPTPSKNAHTQLYLTITISQPKIRIKIPKFMAKRIEMRRRCRSGCDGHEERKMTEEKGVKERYHENEKVRYLSSSAVDCKGSAVQREEFELETDEEYEAEYEEDDDMEREEKEKVAVKDEKSKPGNHLAQKVRSLFSRVVGWKNAARARKIGSERRQTKTRREHTMRTNQHDGKQTQKDEKQENEPENSLTESYLFKKCWYAKEEEEGQVRTMTSNMLSKKSSSYPIFFHRRARWASFVSTSSSCSSDSIYGRQSSTKLSQIPKRGIVSAIKFKMFKSLLKKKMVNGIEREFGTTEKDEERFELCKKRILMGERCRPLSFSGTLRYDKDGVLLPEMFPW